MTFKAGDDFATTVLQNKWDFQQRRDIGWEENYDGSSISVSNGVWTGTYATTGGYVFPLFPGFKGGLFPKLDPTERGLPALGIKSPIVASKYNRLCYELDQTNRGTYAIYWANDPSQPEYWPEGSNQGANIDGYYTTQSATAVINSGRTIYCHDMTNLAASFQVRGGSWTGNIHALRIDPAIAGPAGSVTKLDWIRVVDPSSAPNLTITWSSAGITSADVITLLIDTANSGFNGVPFARFSSGTNPGTYTIPSASFPPGDYYVYVEVRRASSSGVSGVTARSGYSAKIHISDTPELIFTSPSFTSGDEYFASVAGAAENMTALTDVRNQDHVQYPDSTRQYSNEAIVSVPEAEDGAAFTASANTPLAGATESDDQLWMNVSSARPIDPAHFRYLVYHMAADPTNFPDISTKVRDGWVTRPVWWKQNVLTDGGDPGAHVLYEGWHTYTEDLSELTPERGVPWLSEPSVENLRLDPLETHIPTNFYVDYVRLYAQNHTSNGQFTIAFNVAGSAASYDVSLYYDTDNSGFDGTLITTQSFAPGAHSITWNTSGIPDGQSLWVYAVITDGTSTAKYYAKVLVKTGAYVPQPAPRRAKSAFDYNGDLKTDLPLFISHHVQPQTQCDPPKKHKKPKCRTVNIITNNQSWIYNIAGNSTAKNNHVANASLVGLDINGDAYTDLATVSIEGGVMHWRIVESRTAKSDDFAFGVQNDIPVPADFDGDGRDDIAVYRPSDGTWWIRNSATGAMSMSGWGVPGDIPVPGDYDGDGRADLAIWRPADGTWWIVNSGFGAGYASSFSSVYQWGLYGDTPMSFDYNGDGRNDLVVYRQGTWFAYDTNTGNPTVVAWGLPGDVPFAGDFNGDGFVDLAVYRPGNVTWYLNLGNGQTATFAHGVAEAVLPLGRLF